MADLTMRPQGSATRQATAQQRAAIVPENFIEEHRVGLLTPGAEWAGLMLENPVLRGLYRMYTPKVDLVDFDADLLKCARNLDRTDVAVYDTI